ncbi:TPA: hypothetical protein ACU525_004362, partial [Yersinia enterocolitica]
SITKGIHCRGDIYPSYFKLHVRWLHSITRITYLSKLIGIYSIAAFLQLELFRVYDEVVNSPSIG